jgi:hypothetical protein
VSDEVGSLEGIVAGLSGTVYTNAATKLTVGAVLHPTAF